MAKQVDNDTTLFLTDQDGGAKVKPSSVALKAVVRAPVNLAIYDDGDTLNPVVDHVLKVARNFYQGYQNQWSPLTDKWEKADSMYWMAQKEHRMPELTRAKVSASVYHRTVRRLADGAYLATYSEEMPVKFFPDIGIFDDPMVKRRKAVIAEALNRVALYYMKKCDLKAKARDSFNWVYKYGNHIIYTPWEYAVEKKRGYKTVNHNEPVQASDGSTVFKHSRTGEMSVTPHNPELYEVEYDAVTKDWVGFYPLHVDQIFLDNRIEDIDRQSCLLWRSDITRPELWGQAKAGTFRNIDKITQSQQFQQYNWQNQAEMQRITDAGKTTTDSYNSEMYEHWQAWMMLPKISYKTNKKGEATDLEWDQNAEPRRYVMDIVGDIAGNCIVTRFSESPYWSNNVPFVSAHSHSDDSGWYHRGLIELLEDNMVQEQVTKGQLMDNRSLMMFRPLIRQVGRVKNKDMRVGQNTVFDVLTPDALKWMDIPDFTANINNSLEYLSKDSENIAQTPPFFMGQALGGRTSATEFSTIRDQSSAPAMSDIKNLNLQINGGWMSKVKEYVPQFLDKDIAVEVAGPNGEEMLSIVRAEDFQMDLSLEEFAVGEFENRQANQQILTNALTVLSNPAYAPFVAQIGLLERYFKAFSTTFPNPEECLRKDQQVIDMIRQWITQNPQPGQPQAGAPGQPATTGQLGAQPMQGVMGQAGGA